MLGSLAAAFFIAACSTMVSDQPVEGWPQLAMYEHHVSNDEMLVRCLPFVGFGMTPKACAEINLRAGRCDIWYGGDSPSAYVVEHERMHCRGHDHVGETGMKEMLARYRAKLGDVP